MKFEWTVSLQVNTRVGAPPTLLNPNHAHAGTNTRQGTKRNAQVVPTGFGHAVMQAQARDALVGLGWKSGIARAAVDEACAQVGTKVRLERLIAEALRRCPKPLG